MFNAVKVPAKPAAQRLGSTRALQRTAAPPGSRAVRMICQRLLQPAGRFRQWLAQSPNRGAKGIDPSAPTPPGKRVRSGRFRSDYVPFPDFTFLELHARPSVV